MIRAITYIRVIVACRHAAAPEQGCDVDLLQIDVDLDLFVLIASSYKTRRSAPEVWAINRNLRFDYEFAP